MYMYISYDIICIILGVKIYIKQRKAKNFKKRKK